jgi:hypothetical protein
LPCVRELNPGYLRQNVYPERGYAYLIYHAVLIKGFRCDSVVLQRAPNFASALSNLAACVTADD